jgi:hypothetical protein
VESTSPFLLPVVAFYLKWEGVVPNREKKILFPAGRALFLQNPVLP